MSISSKLVIPLCDLRQQKKFKRYFNEEPSTACKNTKKSGSLGSKWEAEDVEVDDISLKKNVQVPKEKKAKVDENKKRSIRYLEGNESKDSFYEEDDSEDGDYEQDDDSEDDDSEDDDNEDDDNEDDDNEDDDNEDADYEEDDDSKDADYGEEDNSEDADYGEEIRNRNKKILKARSVSNTKKTLSAYEQIIQKNIEAKRAFLQSLKVDEAKRDFLNAINAKKKVYKKRQFKSDDAPVLRKSGRLKHFNINLSEKALEEEIMNRNKEILEASYKSKILPQEMSFKDALIDDVYDDFKTDISIQESDSNFKFITYDMSDLKKLTFLGSKKVTSRVISSIAWHPSVEQLIVAAGDRTGHLGVLNVSNNSNSYQMKFCTGRISHLQFNPFNQVQLISSSLDGALYCADMVQHKFNQICSASDTRYTYFDTLSATTFLVAQSNGLIALVDRRVRRRKSFQKMHSCHDSLIKSLNIHPVENNLFVSADCKGSVRIWDLRKLQKNPVDKTNCLKQSVYGAYYSPVTGKSILTTCADNTVNIFDSSDLSKIEFRQRLEHRKHGKDLFKRKAIWLPNSEEAFLINNREYPRIKVCDKNFCTYNISHENLSLSIVNAFHPRRLVLASSNYNGGIIVFI